MSNNLQPIIPGEFFHIYNRAVGNELLFETNGDYVHWIELLKKYSLPVCEIHAYCLLPNHYHLLIKVHETTDAERFSKQMSHAANAYAKWKNLGAGRKGGLFMTPFKRKHLTNDNYITWCLWYIHRNPQHHGYTKDWQLWKYSSFAVYNSDKPSVITKDFFINLFGSKELLLKYHEIQSGDDDIIQKISLE
jgi:putative transposase